MEQHEGVNSSSELKSKEFWSSVLAEFLGTTFLVYIVSSVSVSNEYLHDTAGVSSCHHLHITFAYGLGTATLSLMWPNEGLFNPALVVAFTSTGKLLLAKGVLFIVMEIIGGIAGASLTYALTPVVSRSNSTLGDTVLSDDISTIQGLFIELLLTFILTLAVYAAKDPRRNCGGYDVSLAYGFAVMVCHFVGYKYTSCGVNPSRSFGPAVVRQITGLGKPRTEWEYHWIYWIGPIGGALLAGVLYHFLYSRPIQDYEISKATGTGRDRYRIAGASLTYALTPVVSRSNSTLGDTVLSDDISTIQGLFIELLLTFILTLAVYAAKDPRRNCGGYDVSLAYGFAVMVCHFVGYKYTSCGVNPSRSFGPAVVRQITGLGKPRTEWEYHWIYWIGPIGGALLAGVLYHFLYSRPIQDYEISKATGTGRDRYRESETIL